MTVNTNDDAAGTSNDPTPDGGPRENGSSAADPKGSPRVDDRYGSVELDAECVVVYDRERVGAWIESNRAVPLSVGEPDG